MVGVAFVADFMAVGFVFYSFGVFIVAMETELGLSRAQVSWPLSVLNIAGAVIAPVLGQLVDRIPLRRLMTLGACLMALGFLALASAQNIWAIYLAFGTLLALGSQSMGHLSTAKLVSNWFDARRGTALGIATMGISLSGLVMPPLATALIDRIGWRGGFVAYAGVTLFVVAPVAWLLVVSRPEDVGQRPDGAPAPPPRADGRPPAMPEPERAWRPAELIREPAFWAIGVTFALGFFANSSILTHMVPHARSLGIEPYRAAGVLSAIAGAGVVGKLAFGRIADQLGARLALALSFACQLAGTGLLLVSSTVPTLVATGLVFGFGMGGMVPLQGTVVAERFGRRSFGTAMGWLRPIQVPIHAAGIPFAGLVFDRTGSYALAYQTFAVAYAAAMVGIAIAARRSARRRADPGGER